MEKLFFDLRATGDPRRWSMPVEAGLCVGNAGHRFMYGGIGLAAAVAALQRTTGRPLICATAQYLGFARPPSVIDIDVSTPVEGKNVTQARAKIHVEDREIIAVSAALGHRPNEIEAQWTPAPKAPPPQDCEPDPHWRGVGGDLHSRIEVRRIDDRPGEGRFGKPRPDGRTLLWARPTGDISIDATMLAIFADYVPQGLGTALGKHIGGNSLDNTLRIRRIVPTDWVLCEISMAGAYGGFAHGATALFAQDGELMATSSQSLMVRVYEK